MPDRDLYDDLEDRELDLLTRQILRGEGGTIAGRHTKFDVDDIRSAEAFLKMSGAVELFERCDAEDGWSHRFGGREQLFYHRHMLIGFYLLAQEHSPLWVREVGKLFRHRLTPKAREHLGLPEHSGRQFEHEEAKYWDNAASNAMRRLLRLVDPWFGVPRNRLLSKEARRVALERLDKTVMAERRERLNTFSSLMLEATFKLIPRSTRRKLGSVNISVDQTFVSSVSRRGIRRSTPKPGNAPAVDPFALELEVAREHHDAFVLEPEARWYPTHQSDREGNNRKRSKNDKSADNFGWGYGATFGLLATPDDQRHRVPHIVLGFTLAPANTDIAGECIRSLDQILQRGHQPGHVTGDRGYFAHYPTAKLLAPVRRQGWDIVTDYMPHDLTTADDSNGALIVAGAFTCPALPTHLRSISTADIDDKTRANWVAERTRYELHAKESPNPRTGKQRMQCPAHGAAATLVCPLRDKLHGTQPKAGMQPVRQTEKRRRRIDLPPMVDPSVIKMPDKVCAQTTVTVDLQLAERTRQKYAHGSPEWAARYRSDRNLVEGANAWVKSSGYEELHIAGRRRVRGLAGQQLLVTFLLVAANARRIRTYIRNLEEARDRGLEESPGTPLRRRDRLGYTNYTPGARKKDSFALVAEEEQLLRT